MTAFLGFPSPVRLHGMQTASENPTSSLLPTAGQDLWGPVGLLAGVFGSGKVGGCRGSEHENWRPLKTAAGRWREHRAVVLHRKSVALSPQPHPPQTILTTLWAPGPRRSLPSPSSTTMQKKTSSALLEFTQTQPLFFGIF